MHPDTTSAMCHALRSPLMAITGALSLVEASWSDATPPAQRRVVAAGMRAADQLAVLLEEIQLLARLEAGVGLDEKAPTSLAQILEDACAPLRPRAAQHDQVITLTASPESVEVDCANAVRAVALAIARAVAVSPPGAAIAVWAQREADRVRVCVRDGGGAGPKADPGSVFEPFQALPGGRSGVGLALGRAIARAHGGEAWAELRPGGETAVFLEFPGICRIDNSMRGA